MNIPKSYLIGNLVLIFFLCFIIYEMNEGMKWHEKRVHTVEGYLKQDTEYREKLERKYPEVWKDLFWGSR